MLGAQGVEALRRDVVEALDPDRDMLPGESRVRHAFMESSPVLQAQLGHETIMDLNRLLLGVPEGHDMTLHKSAAIVRQPGAAPVAWHSDFCGHFPLPPLNTGHVLLRSERVPSGIWFYLSGSHPRRGGLAVIEDSHRYVAGSFGSGQRLRAVGSQSVVARARGV